MRKHSDMVLYYEWLEQMEEYENELLWDAEQAAVNEEDEERIVQLRLNSDVLGEYDAHYKQDRHNKKIKGIVCRSGRTIRPLGTGNGKIDPTKSSDDSRKHVSRILVVRSVRKCDWCKTHVCKNTISKRHPSMKYVGKIDYSVELYSLHQEDEEEEQEEQEEEEEGSYCLRLCASSVARLFAFFLVLLAILVTASFVMILNIYN
jgi:hypothetical protein